MRLPEPTKSQTMNTVLSLRDTSDEQTIAQLDKERPGFIKAIYSTAVATEKCSLTPKQATIKGMLFMLAVCDRIYADIEGARLVGEAVEVKE